MFQKGDKVRPLNEPGEGTVIDVQGSKVIVDMEGLTFHFDALELVKVEFDSMIKPSMTKVDVKAADKLRSITAKKELEKFQTPKNVAYELDLHIHELLDRYEYMTNAQILDYQMSCCKRFLSEARQKKWKKVILIHGVGEGVLKSEIHHWLHSLDKIQFHDAPYRTYGYGATEVILY
ncbi:MAG: Smr/MutS family protein [Flavobacteriales bacterium]